MSKRGKQKDQITIKLLDLVKSAYKSQFWVNNELQMHNRKHEIYVKLCEDLSKSIDGTLLPKNLYLTVLRYQRQLTNYFKSEDDDERNTSFASTASTNTESSKNSSFNNHKNIRISKEFWLKIKPVLRQDTKDNKRRWHIPNKDWKIDLHSIVEEQLKINCCMRYSFKNKFAFASSSCRECDCRLEFHSPEDENSETLVVSVKFLNTPDEKLHKNDFKRKISGRKREEFAQQMIGKTPLQVFTNIINEDSNALTKSSVPRIETLRKIKSENRLKEKVHDDEFLALRLLNNSQQFNGVIKELSIYPNYVNSFWSHEQQEIIKNSAPYILMLDATGSVVRTPIFNEKLLYEQSVEKEKPVFFYLLMLKSNDNEKAIAVSQLISQDHSAQRIISWLKQFIKNIKKQPYEVRFDCSSMLFLASSLVFNECTSQKYIELCYKSIKENKLLVKTVLRFDKSHIVKLFGRWKLWAVSKCGKAVKKFYVKILYTFISESDFATLQQIFCHTINMMMSKYQSDGQIESLAAINSYIHKCKCEIYDMNEEENSSSYPYDNEIYLDDIAEYHPETDWISNSYNRIVEKILKNEESETEQPDNLYFLPEFKSDLLRVIKLAPLWTNIMKPLCENYEETCTTSYVESEFSVVKNNVLFGYKLPIRNDIFIKNYMKHVTAQIAIRNHQSEILKKVEQPRELNNVDLKIKLPKSSVKKDKSVFQFGDTPFSTDKLTQENWKNKNNAAIRKTDYVLRENSFYAKNSSNERTKFISTCRINSLFHSLYNFPESSSIMENLKNKTRFTDLILSVHRNPENCDLDQSFANMIIERGLFKVMKDCTINCYGNFDQALSVLPETIKISCKSCNAVKALSHIFCFFTSYIKLITNLEIVVEANIKKTKCSSRKCDSKLNVCFEDFITIETVVHQKSAISLNQIPIMIKIFNQNFRIGAVINHEPGHFTSISMNNLMEYDCTKKEPTHCEQNHKVSPCALFYIKEDAYNNFN